MKIRTQLVLAFLVLSVLPLAGIVLYSYVSSLRAVRAAVEAEAATLTQEMDGRLAALSETLDERIERLGELPLGALLPAEAGPAAEQATDLAALHRDLVTTIGDAAPFVQSIEIVAQPPVPAGPAAGREPPPGQDPAESGRQRQPVPQPPAGVLLDIAEMVSAFEKASADYTGDTEGQEPQAFVWDSVIGPKIEALTEDIERRSAEIVKLAGGLDPAASEEERKRAEERIAQRTAELEADMAERTRRVTILAQVGQKLGESARQLLARDRMKAKLVFGKEFTFPIKEAGKVVGWIMPQVKGSEAVRGVLARTRRAEGEIPFAVDGDGELYTVDDGDREAIAGLHLSPARLRETAPLREIVGDWLVVTSLDPESGLVLGIARPVREPLAEVRRTAARNFAYGGALIGLALIGIVPLSNHMTRSLALLSAGAERIAHGDLDAEVPVRSRSEIGQLAAAFNRMARDLRDHQARLLEEERLRKEREVEQAVLQSEFERKTRELEEARSFQLSLLPKALPGHRDFEVAVSMQTATEVGGDYYDFHLGEDGALTLAIGDATGHGARAGTMVTVVKSLFSAAAARLEPSRFLDEAAHAVRRMDLGRMAMALTLVRLHGSSLTVSAAGMPPLLLHRARTRHVEEVVIEGMPLGGLAFDYQERQLAFEPGDTVLLMTDGFPELVNAAGDPLGYARAEACFAAAAAKAPEEIVADLLRAADEWTSGGTPNDDITFLVVRHRPPSARLA